jgi:hypothetical protein
MTTRTVNWHRFRSFFEAKYGVGEIRHPVFWLLIWSALLWQPAFAASLRYCDQPPSISIAQQDKLLRFSEVIKAELQASGRSLALVARSGLDLSRFNTRYSHSGISLKASPNVSWSIRQLYYACDEGKPKIFDQGMAGFVMGTDSPALGYISVVLLPEVAEKPLEIATLQNASALALLNTKYSANAYPFSQMYQNCNQWVIEILATAFGALGASESPRLQAQSWLRDNGYLPSLMEVGSRFLMAIGTFISMIQSDDHPESDLEKQRYQVSMPSAIEGFVRLKFPQSERLEFCHNDQHIVIHRGWEPIKEGCVAVEGDTVLIF